PQDEIPLDVFAHDYCAAGVAAELHQAMYRHNHHRRHHQRHRGDEQRATAQREGGGDQRSDEAETYQRSSGPVAETRDELRHGAHLLADSMPTELILAGSSITITRRDEAEAAIVIPSGQRAVRAHSNPVLRISSVRRVWAPPEQTSIRGGRLRPHPTHRLH